MKISFWNTHKADIIFIVLFSVFAIFYYDSFLTKGPFNNHAWRQTDSLSLTHFYKEGASFFKPEMHNQLGDGLTSGYTAGEFPILYYIVGQVWKLTGENYLTYRLIWLAILFFGIFAFYKGLRELWGDWFWSAALPLLLFTSPIYIVYGVSFITDAPAFSFALVGGYFFVRYYKERKWKHFLWFLFFFTLVGWLKISSLVGYVFLVGMYVLEVIPFLRKHIKTKIYLGNWKEGLGLLSVFLLIFAWYFYASHFNLKHGFLYTFNNIYPFNLMNAKDIEEMKYIIWHLTSYQYFSRSVISLLLLIGIVNLFLWKKMTWSAYLATPVVVLGCGIYFYLWAPLMGVHDYYYIAMLVMLLAILIPFVYFIRETFPTIFRHPITKVLMAVFVVYNFMYGLSITKYRTLSRDIHLVTANNPILYEKMEALNGAYANLIHFQDIQPMLREWGIRPEDKVISIPDPSFSISLYIMNQKGWTGSRGFEDKGYIPHLIEKGAKYLILTDGNIAQHENVAPYVGEKVGSYEEIIVYRTKKL